VGGRVGSKGETKPKEEGGKQVSSPWNARNRCSRCQGREKLVSWQRDSPKVGDLNPGTGSGKKRPQSPQRNKFLGKAETFPRVPCTTWGGKGAGSENGVKLVRRPKQKTGKERENNMMDWRKTGGLFSGYFHNDAPTTAIEEKGVGERCC